MATVHPPPLPGEPKRPEAGRRRRTRTGRLRPRRPGGATPFGSRPAPLVALALLALPAVAAGPARAPLFTAFEKAEAVVVGRVERVERLDRHGYLAHLAVERDLGAGTRAGRRDALPPRILVAFEELAGGRPPRLRTGDRVLAALGGRPRGSLWARRLAALPADAPVRALAANGRGIRAEPDRASLELLAAWLAAQRRAPDSPASLDLLAELVQRGEPSVALEAVTRMASAPGLEAKLPKAAFVRLREALADPHRPLTLRSALLDLAAQRRLRGLRPVVAELAAPEAAHPLELAALRALAAIDGGLAAERLASLLADPRPEARRLAVRSAHGELGSGRLRQLAGTDPDPGVRGAAVSVLLGREGPAAIEDGVRALRDPDAAVRAAAARALGGLGEPAVGPLLAEVERGTGESRKAALAALAACGDAGHRALARLAASHADPAVRGLARLALGHLDAGH